MMGCGTIKGPTAVDVTPRVLKISSGYFVSENHGVFKKCYQVSGELGSGAYATVLAAVHLQTGAKRAVKIIAKKRIISQEAKDMYLSEVEILKQVDHPNIVRVYEYFQDENYIYIVTELCEGGELLEKILVKKVLPEALVASYMRQVFSAVAYCHTNHIVHRDLKLENLLLHSQSDDLIKVIDFGTSVLFDPHKKLRRRLGTVCYIAPEVMGAGYNEKCDVWSCGVILYVLLCGHMPFIGEDDHTILQNAARGNYSMTTIEWLEVSDPAKTLVRSLLQTDPKKRPNALQAFNDPWVQQSELHVPQVPMITEALQNLTKFHATNQLQRAVLSFIASKLITTEEGQELTAVFQALDKTGSGRLSRKELRQGFQTFLGEDLDLHRVGDMLEQIDTDNSGFIEYSEFLAAAMNREKLLSKERLKAAFAAFDQDQNGKITSAELRLLLDHEQQVQEAVWTNLISVVDQNGDGEVDWKEFKDMMLSMD